MDFASLMAAELSKGKSSSGPTRKSDVESQRLAAYEADRKARTEARLAKAAAKRRHEEELAEEDHRREEKRQMLAGEMRRRREERDAEEERARRKRLGLPELPATPKSDGNVEAGADEGEEDIPDEEAVERLRGMGEPARLFGESHGGRVRRLRQVTKKRAMASTESAPIPTTLELVPEKDMKISGDVPPASDKEARTWLYRRMASYFTLILKEYEKAMKAEQRDTAQSRSAYVAMEQCRENMKPLFRKMERLELDETLVAPIVEIVQAAQERRYVDANDGYLRLSIGKAAWPIGVTMVGIHERSAREKLHTGEKGHVMGDEVTRKFLQSIKRCLTFAQVRWPPEDGRQLMG